MIRAVRTLAALLALLSFSEVFAQETVTFWYWSYRDPADESHHATSFAAACSSVGTRQPSATETWGPWTANGTRCEAERTFCSTGTLQDNCDDNGTRTQTQLVTPPIVLGTKVVDEPPSCESRQGTTQHIEFTHYFDGPVPELAGLFCQGGCQLDGTLTTNTEYSQIDGEWQPSRETYSGTVTFTGSECSPELASTPAPDGSNSAPTDETPDEPPPHCTADYYTNASGEYICGTPPQTEVSDNGTETTTETEADGTMITTVTTPDGITTTTTAHPDGSVSTNISYPDGSETNNYDENEDDGTEEEEDECPSNQYTLNGGVLVCKDDLGTQEALDGVEQAVREGNDILEEISDSIGFEFESSTEGFEFEDNETELDEIREEWKDTLTGLMGQLRSTFTMNLPTGAYSCNRSVSVFGVTLNFCIPPGALDFLPALGNVVLLLAHLQAAFIIFRG